jgi:hypothetical protein
MNERGEILHAYAYRTRATKDKLQPCEFLVERLFSNRDAAAATGVFAWACRLSTGLAPGCRKSGGSQPIEASTAEFLAHDARSPCVFIGIRSG